MLTHVHTSFANNHADSCYSDVARGSEVASKWATVKDVKYGSFELGCIEMHPGHSFIKFLVISNRDQKYQIEKSNIKQCLV